MGSTALTQLLDGLDEIEALQRANPSPSAGGGFDRPAITRAIGRAEVVLLSGHLEQYVYGVHQEMVDVLEGRATLAGQIPVVIRLRQSRPVIDTLGTIQWDRREDLLRQQLGPVRDLWDDALAVSGLEADTLLEWMRSPTPENLVRAFRPWGIDNIFQAITRSSTHRSRIWLKIRELVDKRNNIAHGDLTVEATHLDVRSYKRAVREFCTRTDLRCAARVASISSPPRPW